MQRIATSTTGRTNRRPGGFTYLVVLAAVLVLGIALQGVSTLTSAVVRAEREAELLFRGRAYARAIATYYWAGRPPHTYPRRLEHLLDDPRFPGMRHLRILYPEPMGESGEWTLVRAADGGIQGVASPSELPPRKRANFPPELEDFAEAESYSDWVFEYVPQGE